MRLYIAEKPSVGRAVADVLPKPHQKGEGFITVANGDVVTWCIGHLLEQAAPEAYDPRYKKWAKQHLPIVPLQWQLQVKPQTRKQFNTVKKLIKGASLLINMGDPDRVGQILVDEVINYSGVSKAKRDGAKRCLVSDMNPDAIKRALGDLRQNTDFIPLATSALARARADWLYGINMTRLCTLLGQGAGYSGVLSIGRVQTPVLGLIVHRDRDINQFVSKPFYEVVVTLSTLGKQQFLAKWQPSEACEAFMDEDRRVLSKQLAQVVVQKVTGKPGTVKAVKRDNKRQPAPLPYSLSVLQIDASKRFSLSAQKTLDICQQLYERHKLITYPRSDCRFLPVGHYDHRHTLVEAIAKTAPNLAIAAGKADLSLTSKAWNNAKVKAHHGIIPTSKAMHSERLTQDEKNVYELIARHYLIQFYPPFEYSEHQIDSEVEGGLFIAKQKEITAEGWKALFPRNKAAGKDEQYSHSPLPRLQVGESVKCIDSALNEKKTSPPKRFTDATLLAAMTGIARFVADPEIKKVLKETDGLGTEATRAGIIELLFKRQFLARKGKEIHSTDIGRSLVSSLPNSMVVPDMTAHWESQLEAISDENLRYEQFMQPLEAGLRGLITEVGGHSFARLKNKGSKKAPKKTKDRRRKKPIAS